MSPQLAIAASRAIVPPPHIRSEAFVAERGEIALDLSMRHAGCRRVGVRYEISGADDAPLLLVAGGISASRHARANGADESPGWWEGQCGEGQTLRPGDFRVVGFDWIGADGSLDAVIDPADQADAFAAALDALGIARVDAFVGASYGAMVALQFAARYAHRVARVIAISGGHRAHPWSSALRALQRRAVVLGALQCDERQGLALARQLAMLSYRTPAEFDARFGSARVAGTVVRVAAEEYLDHCSATWLEHATPTGFVRLSESIDLQRLDPAAVTVPLTVVAVRQDLLVPLDDLRTLARSAGGPAELHVIDSVYGHDAFLKEPRAIGAILEHVLHPGSGTSTVATASNGVRS